MLKYNVNAGRSNTRKKSIRKGSLLPAALLVGLIIGSTSAEPEGIKTFILVGNSALSGRDPVRDTVEHPRAWKYVLYEDETGEDERFTWMPAKEPICNDGKNTGQKGGPGLPFLKRLVDVNTTEHFGVIQHSGSAWTIQARMQRGQQEYDVLVQRAIHQKDKHEIVALVSMFGLVEVQKGKHETYLEDVKKMVEQFRDDLDMPNLPYVHSEYPVLAGGMYDPEGSRAQILIDQEQDIPQVIANTIMIPSDGLTIWGGDGRDSHYDRAGCVRWGERVVDSLVEWGIVTGEVSINSGVSMASGHIRKVSPTAQIIIGPLMDRRYGRPASDAVHYMLNGRTILKLPRKHLSGIIMEANTKRD